MVLLWYFILYHKIEWYFRQSTTKVPLTNQYFEIMWYFCGTIKLNEALYVARVNSEGSAHFIRNFLFHVGPIYDSFVYFDVEDFC